ncbi:hypothetical protein ABZ860_42170 [Microbispora sp. NPDC046973]|uniref:hypothetical protein n=1 Tax=Microbispora sp. NPDC046973 TaxID=3155022 RepID=UPI0033E6A535
MRTAYQEALVMIGYVLGMVVTPVVGKWASGRVGGRLLDEAMLTCTALFEVAFLFGLARLLFRGSRRLAGASARRRRTRKAG